MTDINTVLVKTMEFNWNIRSLFRLSIYKNCDDLSGLIINYENSEQFFVLDEMSVVMDKLTYVEISSTSLVNRLRKTSVCLEPVPIGKEK